MSHKPEGTKIFISHETPNSSAKYTTANESSKITPKCFGRFHKSDLPNEYNAGVAMGVVNIDHEYVMFEEM